MAEGEHGGAETEHKGATREQGRAAREHGGAEGEHIDETGVSGGAKRRHLSQPSITCWLGFGDTIYIYIYFGGLQVYRLSLFSLMNPICNASAPIPAQCHSFDLQLANIAQQAMPSTNANPFLVDVAKHFWTASRTAGSKVLT